MKLSQPTQRSAREHNAVMRQELIPNFRRSFAIDAKLPKFKLALPDPTHEFNAGDGDRGASKAVNQA